MTASLTILGSWLSLCSVLGDSKIEYLDDKGTQVLSASGEVTSETPQEVIFKTNSEELKLTVNRVVTIEYDGAPSELLNARQLERQNRLEEANKELETVLPQVDQNVSEFLARSIQFAILKNRCKLALLDPSKTKGAIDAYEKDKETLSRTRHYYPVQELIGQVYMNAGDFAKADEVFETLRALDWPGYKEKALVFQGVAALKQKKPLDAVNRFDEVIKSSGEGTGVNLQKFTARIGKADALVMNNKAEEAEKIVREVIEEASADEAYLDALAPARNTLGDALRKLGRNKEAALDGYMWVHVMYNRDANEHARAVFNLIPVLTEIGYPERAAEMTEILKSRYGSSEWAKGSAGG